MNARTSLLLPVASLLVAAAPLPAQETTWVTYATYYDCGSTGERLNAIMRDRFKPGLDGAVDAGTISAWGLLGHHTGGTWDRAAYVSAPTVAAVVDAVEGLGAEMSSALQELDALCPDHEDYIWERVTGSESEVAALRDRPAAALSTYWVCDVSRQARADSLVTQVMAPLLGEQVSSGRLTSWSWLAHVLGGKYRRLAVYDGADAAALLSAQGALVEELQSKHPDAFREFGEICSSHQDYLWNVGVPAAQ